MMLPLVLIFIVHSWPHQSEHLLWFLAMCWLVYERWLDRWSLEFYILLTSKVISGRVQTCNSVHSWWFYSAAPLSHQAANTMTWYLTQWHYTDTELTSPCLILLMQSTKLGSEKYQFGRPLIWVYGELNSVEGGSPIISDWQFHQNQH